MSKQVYISADYSEDNGDRDVVDLLTKWGADDLHKVDFIDMSQVAAGSVSEDPDCRACDLKKEFNSQINASSAVICVVGDKTASREAGASCRRASEEQADCSCTPYKQNTNGSVSCKVKMTFSPGEGDDVGCINQYSYLKHEFVQAKKREKTIVILYNSLRKEEGWLPSYMEDYKLDAQPFWKKNVAGEKVGDYAYIKEVLGF